MKTRAMICSSIIIAIVAVSATAKSAYSFPDAVNTFGISLLKRLPRSAAKPNTFISPLSAFCAFGILMNGATGETRKELERHIVAAGIEREALNGAAQQLLSYLDTLGRNDFDFQSAHGLWFHERYTLLRPFTTTIESKYRAMVQVLDLSDPTTPVYLNNWINDRTGGKIPWIVPSRLSPSLKILLINAGFFRARWTFPFDPAMTHDAPFTSYIGPITREAKTAMMVTNASYRQCITADSTQMIELPYGRSNAASMVVILPRRTVAIDTFEESFTLKHWQELRGLLNKRTPAYGTVMMPRISMSYELKLSDVLKEMGIQKMFSEQAELKDLSGDPLSISEMIQKTYLGIHESGTEADPDDAGKEPSADSLSKPKPHFTFSANRPFFIVISEKKTGVILFLGTVKRPG